MKIIDVGQDFNKMIPNWAKGINDFLIDENTFKYPTSLKPIFYTGYGVDNQEFVATRILDGFREPNPSKRYIISCIKDLEINPIKIFCKENNLKMDYEIFPYHDSLFGDVKMIRYSFKKRNNILKKVLTYLKNNVIYRRKGNKDGSNFS